MRAAAAIIILIGASATADTIYVPGDQPTIQAGIDAADAGDEILVAPGTYFENIDFNKEVAVRSTAGPDVTTIDGQGQTVVVCFFGGPDAVLEGFTLTGGGPEPPPFVTFTQATAIFLHFYGELAVIDCVVRDNDALDTGWVPMMIHDAYATVVNCEFRDNPGFGSWTIYLDESTTTLTNCTFSGRDGLVGAIGLNFVTLDIDGCTFEDNHALIYGGAVTSFTEYNNLTINGCTFARNSGELGGALELIGGGTLVSDSTFCENSPAHIAGSYVDGGGNVFAATCAELCPADIAPPGGDGKVSASDLLALLGNWHATGLGDVNGDGTVNTIDLLILLGAWGDCF